MPQPHPHAGATYEIIARKDGAFEIAVLMPDPPSAVTITGLATRAAAERWIAQHQAAVAAGLPGRRAPRFKPSKPK